VLGKACHHQSCANGAIDNLTHRIKSNQLKKWQGKSATWGFLWTDVTAMPLMISDAQRRERRSGCEETSS
jgi:hypothetical protein